MDRHGQRFLTKPTPHSVNIKSGFDKQRSYGMPQPVKRETRRDGPFPFESAYRFNERRIKAALGPRRSVRRRR
jgi:hypothetical protein